MACTSSFADSVSGECGRPLRRGRPALPLTWRLRPAARGVAVGRGAVLVDVLERQRPAAVGGTADRLDHADGLASHTGRLIEPELQRPDGAFHAEQRLLDVGRDPDLDPTTA